MIRKLLRRDTNKRFNNRSGVDCFNKCFNQYAPHLPSPGNLQPLNICTPSWTDHMYINMYIRQWNDCYMVKIRVKIKLKILNNCHCLLYFNDHKLNIQQICLFQYLSWHPLSNQFMRLYLKCWWWPFILNIKKFISLSCSLFIIKHKTQFMIWISDMSGLRASVH